MSQQEVKCPRCSGGNSPLAIWCQRCGLDLWAPAPKLVQQITVQDERQAGQAGRTPIMTALLVFGIVLLGALWIMSAMNRTSPAATGTPTSTRQVVSQNQPTALPAETESPVPPTPVPPTVEQPITVTGKGDEQSAPFQLAGGTYISEWSVTKPGASSCVFYLRMEAADPDSFLLHNLVSIRSENIVKEADPSSWAGRIYIYHVKPGQYYIISNTTCSEWAVTLRRP